MREQVSENGSKDLWRSIVLAARPKTLPAAIVPVWLGSLLAWKLSGEFGRENVYLAIATLMGAVWIQIATNFFNDAIDADKGADTEARLGPTRVTASGLLSRRAVYGLAAVSLGIAVCCGAYLFWNCGWPIVLIGIPALYFCYGYTGGPIPLAYCGLGELFVILWFGLIAVLGTVFVHLGEWRIEALLLGAQVGLLSTVLISVNNLRDVEEDTGNAKRTLAVKLGVTAARWIITLEVVLAYLLGIFWLRIESLGGSGEAGMGDLMFYPLPASVLGGVILYGVWKLPPSELYNRLLAVGGMQLLLYGVLFTGACF